MKVTKEALLKIIDSFGEKGEFPPLYDSDDLKTRKQIGLIVDVWLDPENQTELKYKAELFDKTFVEGNTGINFGETT